MLQRASRGWQLSAYILMISFAALTLFPLIWLFYSSFKLNAEIMFHPLALPKKPTFFNYTESWAKGGLGIALINSFIYTITATVSTMLLAMAAAFGLTKFPFKSSKVFTSPYDQCARRDYPAFSTGSETRYDQYTVRRYYSVYRIRFTAFRYDCNLICQGYPERPYRIGGDRRRQIPLHILGDDYALIRSRDCHYGYSFFSASLERIFIRVCFYH